MKEISVQELCFNPMTMIGGEWMLIAAGNEKDGYNAMTASWGHLGSIWQRPGRKAHMGLPTVVVYLRPQRYTKEFVDREEIFTLSFFDASYKKALTYLGTHSGRDGNKFDKAGLTPVFERDTTYFKEAKLVFICRKLYHAPLQDTGFVDKSLVENNYPQKDFHEMYVGEIFKVLIKEDKKEG